MKLNPLREMFLFALMYLPMAFFLWFVLASPLTFPLTILVDAFMTQFFPDLVIGIDQVTCIQQLSACTSGQAIIEMQVLTSAGVPADVLAQAEAGRIPVMELTLRPLIYTYGIPLLAGLVMATPLTIKQRCIQISIGLLALLPVQMWGVVWEIFKIFYHQLGPAGIEAMEAYSWMNENMVALSYQFGYLIFPALAPVIVWVSLNKNFLESLVLKRASIRI